MNDHDVRMVEGAGRARLFQQANSVPRTATVAIVQNLQRDVTSQPRIARTVDLAHAAGSQWTDNLVWTELGCGERVRDTASFLILSCG
jgi:hypothetical protein